MYFIIIYWFNPHTNQLGKYYYYLYFMDKKTGLESLS